MDDPKPIASLSPALLARKGGAKPAMRPGLATLSDRGTAPADPAEDPGHDLGWNDFHGEDGADQTVELGQVVPITRAAEQNGSDARRQQDRLASTYAAPKRSARRSALRQGRKAAFTLRLDAERHLKLRLACTADNRSAQQLVTEALDRLLSEMPELDALAGQIGRKRGA